MRKRGQRLEAELDSSTLATLREAHTSIADIARQFGVSHATIRRRLPEHLKGYRKLTPQVIELRKRGASYREIGREFSCDSTAVMNYLRRNAPDLVPSDEGVCEGCGRTARLVSDHDHTTGKNRGRICQRCNVCLGQFHDDATALQGLTAYLIKHTAQASQIEA